MGELNESDTELDASNISEESKCIGRQHQFVLESKNKDYMTGTYLEEWECHICGIFRLEVWKLVGEGKDGRIK